MPLKAGEGKAREGCGVGEYWDVLGGQDRAEGLGESPVQRPSCMDMSGPVLRKLWDSQRDEQLGDEVNKIGAGSWADPVVDC